LITSGHAVKTLESKETRASKEIRVTHNSVFAAHRLQCRMTTRENRHPAFLFPSTRPSSQFRFIRSQLDDIYGSSARWRAAASRSGSKPAFRAAAARNRPDRHPRQGRSQPRRRGEALLFWRPTFAPFRPRSVASTARWRYERLRASACFLFVLDVLSAEPVHGPARLCRALWRCLRRILFKLSQGGIHLVPCVRV